MENQMLTNWRDVDQGKFENSIGGVHYEHDARTAAYKALRLTGVQFEDFSFRPYRRTDGAFSGGGGFSEGIQTPVGSNQEALFFAQNFPLAEVAGGQPAGWEYYAKLANESMFQEIKPTRSIMIGRLPSGYSDLSGFEVRVTTTGWVFLVGQTPEIDNLPLANELDYAAGPISAFGMIRPVNPDVPPKNWFGDPVLLYPVMPVEAPQEGVENVLSGKKSYDDAWEKISASLQENRLKTVDMIAKEAKLPVALVQKSIDEHKLDVRRALVKNTEGQFLYTSRKNRKSFREFLAELRMFAAQSFSL